MPCFQSFIKKTACFADREKSIGGRVLHIAVGHEGLLRQALRLGKLEWDFGYDYKAERTRR